MDEEQQEASSSTHRKSVRKGKQKAISPPAVIPSAAGDDSESTLTSPSDRLRNLPTTEYNPKGPLPNTSKITVFHPANNQSFLQLDAYDRLPGSDPSKPEFGVHHDTLLNACQIIANNETGYISKYRDRDTQGVDIGLDSILVPGYYYYHVKKVDLNPYPICHGFKSWHFPHGEMPRSWSVKSPALPELTKDRHSWGTVSVKIKERDKKCRVTGSSEWLSTVRLIPKEEVDWLLRNDMHVYLGGANPLDQSPRNLLALRFDCHLGGFDRAQFVFVPKWGKLAVHFLCESSEFANQYHDIVFEHGNTVSREALYSRFAWAVLKLAAIEMTPAKKFTFVETPKDLEPDIEDGEAEGGGKGRGGKGEGSSKKRKREDQDGGEGDGSEHDEDAADQSGNYQPGRRARKRPDVLLQGSNAWLTDVLSQLDNGHAEEHAHELKKDLDTAARLPFFVDSNISPTADQWDLPWYPGVGVVEKLKKQYIASHPNIQAHHISNKFQSDGVFYDSD